MAAHDDHPPRAVLGSTRLADSSRLCWSCCSASALFAAFVVPAGTYPTLRGDAFSALFYYANWHFIANGSNYFNQSALTSPLTHTWSLAVEEQFYLVWPLVVLGVFKLWKSTRVLLVVCVVGALASAVEMGVLYSPGDVNRLYYGTDTRAQSLLVGAALAVSLSLWADHRHRAGTSRPEPTDADAALGGDPAWAVQTPRGRAAVLAVGLAGVGVSAVLWTLVSYNDAVAYRGGFFLAALATAAVLFSVVCSQRSVLARCLSVAPLRYVGRISYGMYLWHFPLFIYLDHARTGLTGYPLFARTRRRHPGGRHGVLLRRRATHPTGHLAARLARVGDHAGGGPGHRGRSRGGDHRFRRWRQRARAAPPASAARRPGRQ